MLRSACCALSVDLYFFFFFKQKTAYEIGLGIPAEPLFRSEIMRQILTSRLSLSKHLAHNLGNLLLLGKIGVFHNRRNASSRLLLLISKHLILCIYLVFRKIGRAVQQECRDRKSGSAGMPRPISYAVFCLKKKQQILSLITLDCMLRPSQLVARGAVLPLLLPHRSITSQCEGPCEQLHQQLV